MSVSECMEWTAWIAEIARYSVVELVASRGLGWDKVAEGIVTRHLG